MTTNVVAHKDFVSSFNEILNTDGNGINCASFTTQMKRHFPLNPALWADCIIAKRMMMPDIVEAAREMNLGEKNPLVKKICDLINEIFDDTKAKVVICEHANDQDDDKKKEQK